MAAWGDEQPLHSSTNGHQPELTMKKNPQKPNQPVWNFGIRVKMLPAVWLAVVTGDKKTGEKGTEMISKIL